ncbi:minichromosome maintenance protein-like protein [Leishmania mexicana MHOM/GT/2001/U1103]|uniref:DNA replication licensing factor n=1 Tax=Leishmania mexicana (strain MHOM/GT/2001/U1103) TaxID=929439 RepID=E9AKD9_LEIMU|nr:minichromosome maintenance protein-like protein [Leishmania mexicana MHOM/GT/2001/U1103]CBZ23390.1 minichromosome maintenance protein-like protein [Leishmania mexicana MHOM/GT/2001/U1103]
MGGRRGGDGATRVTSTALPAAAATTAQADAWMDALWEIHCGTPLAGAVRYTDAIVETMWGLFQPLLSELDVYPLAIADMHPETVTATTAATVPFTDFIVLRLMEPATPARHGHRHRGGDRGDVEEDPQNEFGNALTAVMRTALLEQPCIVLALVEFFTAVWLYQYEARKLSTLQNAQHGTRRQGDGGAQGTGPPTVAAAASKVPALRRVYAAVSGDVRHAMPFDQLGAAQLGRVLTIKGTVVRMSPARISCVCMSYRCGHCGVVKQQRTQDGVLTYPGPCASARCRGYKWTPLTDQAVCEEVQLLRLQEHTTFFDVSSSLASPSGSSGATQQGGGGGNGSNAGNSGSQRMGSSGMHVMIEVELRAPWLDAVTVGDSVCVCGVLETRRGEGKQGSGMQQVCLRARAVRSLRSQGNSASSPSLSSIAALQRRQRDGALLFATMGPGGCRDGPWRLAHGGGAAMFGDGTSTGGALRGDGEGGADDEVMLDTAAQLGGVRPTAIVAATTASAITALPSGARVSFPSGLDAWSAEETGRFYEVARHPQWFARLTASVAPSIFGMELVKQALLLSIVGGNRDKNGGETRSSIHVLLLGDPGLGKSQLLRAACAVAPRSSFVCAHTSSSCGLTMTLTRDPVSGETTFEAGAVVHGDGGITCLDEIDKGVQEHKALLEVMEQETVSLAKAGMIFSMPVRTSILAAGNPIGGRVDPSKSLAANVNISPALLSRFDIIACLRNPHGHTSRAQQALTDHVLQWHRRGPAGGDGGEGGSGDEQGHGRGAGPLPLPLVQRFLLFCRSQCQPTLCPEACDVLKAHYLAQRQHLAEPQHGLAHGATASCAGGAAGHLSDSSSASGPLPRAAVGLEATVTPRYLQALIRVAEARAKLELRHAVTREDAEYAVQLLQSCLHSFDGLAASGSAAVGAAAGSGDVGAGRRPAKLNQRDAVLQRLKLAIVEENGGVNLFTVQAILDVCESVGCRSAAAMLRQLNEHGFLLQKGSNRYCLRGC